LLLVNLAPLTNGQGQAWTWTWTANVCRVVHCPLPDTARAFDSWGGVRSALPLPPWPVSGSASPSLLLRDLRAFDSARTRRRVRRCGEICSSPPHAVQHSKRLKRDLGTSRPRLITATSILVSPCQKGTTHGLIQASTPSVPKYKVLPYWRVRK
jgi:hypothetical protein